MRTDPSVTAGKTCMAFTARKLILITICQCLLSGAQFKETRLSKNKLVKTSVVGVFESVLLIVGDARAPLNTHPYQQRKTITKLDI